MPLRYYFRDRVLIPDAVAGENLLEHDKVGHDKVYNYDEITIENRTSAFTRLLIGVVNGGLFHTYEEQQSPSAATLYPFHPNKTLKISEGEQLQAKCTGVTLHDELVMFVAGYYEIKEKPKPVEEEAGEADD